MKGILLLLLLSFTLFISADEPRIVAIGDIHGDVSAFVSVLKSVRLVDKNGNWSGGDSILVQTGDLVDRGSQGRQVLDLVMKLESQAPKQRGRVYPLLGNHEIMNIVGDLRYVVAEDYANFANQNSERRLKEAYDSFKKLEIQKAEKRKLPVPEFPPQHEQEWMQKHPAGFLEHREAFGPRGKYGKWLRKKDAVLDLNHNIFLHGGISPKIASLKVQEINERIHRELELFDRCQRAMVDQKIILPFFTLDEMMDAAKKELEARQKDQMLETFLGLPSWFSMHPDGPLWFRRYAMWTEEELSASMPLLLKAYQAQRIIVGHSVQEKGEIRSRHNHGVIMIDTGMNSSAYPAGRASALEIEGGKLTAVYGENRVPLN